MGAKRAETRRWRIILEGRSWSTGGRCGCWSGSFGWGVHLVCGCADGREHGRAGMKVYV
jgi:hypothetical protein